MYIYIMFYNLSRSFTNRCTVLQTWPGDASHANPGMCL